MRHENARVAGGHAVSDCERSFARARLRSLSVCVCVCVCGVLAHGLREVTLHWELVHLQRQTLCVLKGGTALRRYRTQRSCASERDAGTDQLGVPAFAVAHWRSQH